MVQNNKEDNNNSIPTTVHPYILQIIQVQAKALNQFSSYNQSLVERTISFVDRFLNYDMQKIKQYDEFNRFLMEQKNIEKGIHNPQSSSQQQQQQEPSNNNNNNPILDILNKLNFLKTQQEVSQVNPAVPPAHIPIKGNNAEVHPDFVPKSAEDYNNKFEQQMKTMQTMIEKLEKLGAVPKENDNEGNS